MATLWFTPLFPPLIIAQNPAKHNSLLCKNRQFSASFYRLPAQVFPLRAVKPGARLPFPFSRLFSLRCNIGQRQRSSFGAPLFPFRNGRCPASSIPLPGDGFLLQHAFCSSTLFFLDKHDKIHYNVLDMQMR